MHVKVAFALLLMAILSGCGLSQTPRTWRIALLAPFEGRYREVGYNALYAARLALHDAAVDHIELLPIDDGGSATSAAARAHGLARDPLVLAAVTLGYAATDSNVQHNFADVPILIVGNWDASPTHSGVFQLSNPQISSMTNLPARIEVTDAARAPAPLVASEIASLNGFVRLRDRLDDVTIVTSAALPNTEWAERFMDSDLFAPAPGLLALLTYDAVRLLATIDAHDRKRMRAGIERSDYAGLSGRIRFVDGYWQDAPIHRYRYASSGLLTVDDIIE
ncbi:MAG: hypothetical protein SNJ59_00730 [Aggregatilineales bacterium]